VTSSPRRCGFIGRTLRELWRRFKTVRTEEEAIEAIGDLRELLVDEDLLLPSEGLAR
jgi:hypothetical protein